MQKPRKKKTSKKRSSGRSQADNAYKKFIEPYEEALTLYIRKFFPKHRELADDAMQRTRMEIVKSAGTFRGESEPKAFAFGIALNCVRRTERERNRYYRYLSSLFFAEEKIAGKAKDPKDLLAHSLPEQRKTIGKILDKAKLSKSQRTAMDYLLGQSGHPTKSVREAAAHFKKTQLAIKQIIYRARKRILKNVPREMLEELY